MAVNYVVRRDGQSRMRGSAHQDELSAEQARVAYRDAEVAQQVYQLTAAVDDAIDEAAREQAEAARDAFDAQTARGEADKAYTVEAVDPSLLSIADQRALGLLMTTRWRADTCDCIIEYEWENVNGNETTRAHVHRRSQPCAQHAGLSGEALMTAVLTENRAKNTTHAKLVAAFPALASDDALVAWRYDEARTLHVTVSGPSAPTAAEVEAWAKGETLPVDTLTVD